MKKERKSRRRKIGTPTRASKKRNKRAKAKPRKRTGKKMNTKRAKKGARKITRKIKIKRSKVIRKKRIVKRRAAKRFPVQIQRPVYSLSTDFEFFYELRDLILKSSPAEKDKIVERLNKIGRIKLAIMSGVFINKENLDPLTTDLFIVGDDIDRRKLRAFLRAIEAEVGKEVKFAVMDKDEFQYRLAMFDRFIRVLLEGPHEKLINKLGI